MQDLISRQAAIDAIEHRLAEPVYQHVGEDWYVGMNCAESEIYELPPAQPALDEWCTDCKEYDQERHCCPRWNRVIRTALDDARKELPPVQQEEAIPLAWLEEQAKWFESMDNAFAKIEANNIRVMIKKWRGEKGERSD